MRRLVAFATSAFVVLILLLHWWRPDADPVSRGISRYAAGPQGLSPRSPLPRWSWPAPCAVAAWLLRSAPWAIAAAGLTGVLLTPLGLDPSAGAPYAVHQSGALLFFISATWATRRMHRAAGWAATICLVLFLAAVALRGPWFGVWQRALFASIAAALLRFGVTPESPSPRARARP
ncbi:MAG: DUF92 domain-containing protein [Acidobacteria bacterium]|nr:DUF92 domain-containing protein [Acidobacteriota bacterium]